MGFLNFLKPKKVQKSDQPQLEMPFQQPQGGQSNGPELYSELPNLPEAPESANVPEIALPQMQGFEDFSLPEAPLGANPEAQKPDENSKAREAPAPLLPDWPDTGKTEGNELPELAKTPTGGENEQPPWFSFQQASQETKPILKETETEERGKLININNSFFMKANDYRRVKDSFEHILRMQKKHHRLTDIKKEENVEYDKMNALVEDIQRKLMQVDKTLFEEKQD